MILPVQYRLCFGKITYSDGVIASIHNIIASAKINAVTSTYKNTITMNEIVFASTYTDTTVSILNNAFPSIYSIAVVSIWV